ncbi:MAG: hypothetical protein ABI369_07255 [Acetobacteraceae bacterium]
MSRPALEGMLEIAWKIDPGDAVQGLEQVGMGADLGAGHGIFVRVAAGRTTSAVAVTSWSSRVAFGGGMAVTIAGAAAMPRRASGAAQGGSFRATD